MTNDNNTRTKANAVFFSVIMVLSMVAVGFAAAPAAAVGDADISGSIDSNTEVAQEVVTHDYSITVNTTNLTASDNGSIAFGSLGSGSPDSVTVDSGPASVTGTGPINLDSGASGEVTVTGTVTIDWTSQSTGTTVTPTATITDSGDSTTGVTDLTQISIVDARPDSTDATKNVDDGATIYQGEEVNFVGNLSGQSELIGLAGDAENQQLSENVDSDQTLGRYGIDGDGNSNGIVTVAQPSIFDAEVQLDNGEDISGSSVSTGDADSLSVLADFNFAGAEPIEVTIEDPSGTDITDEVTTNGKLITQDEGTIEIDLQNEDAGEYTVILEGEDDLDTTSEELTFTLSSDTDLSLETTEDSVTRGTNAEYTLSGGTSGQTHVVAVEASDFRDTFDSASNPTVFRNTGDTNEVGFTNGTDTDTNPNNLDGDITHAYAIVEMDGSQAVGTLRTDALDATSVTIDGYATGVTPAQLDDTSTSSETDTDLTVEEGELTADSPSGTYTIGSEADVNGTATGIDAVDVYVRDNNEWQLLINEIDVDSDDTYELEDVVLSDSGDSNIESPGASILGQAGTYRYGVIDSAESVSGDSQINTSAFSSATTTTQSIRTVEGELNAELETVNGQINYDIDDQTDITGTAEGQSSEGISLVFVDSRGGFAVRNVDVDSDGTIDEEDFNIPQTVSGTQLAEGTVTAHFISPGRDGNIGDGDIPGQSGDSVPAFESWLSNNVSTNLNAEQVRERVVAETTEDTASDDLMVTQSFRYAESQTTIDSVYPEEAQADGVNPVATGETMVVEGTTNLRPDDGSITLEVLNEDGESLQISSTDSWETSGQWSATVDTSDLEPGTYTVLSDDGTNTDRAEVEIVEERQTDDGDDGEDGDDGSTDGDDGSTDGDDGSTDGDDGSTDGDDGGSDGDDGGSDGDDGGDGGTDDSTPGFGALVALVALIAAALLATRRDN
ncbi:HVO_2072 family ArtA-dependent S-layer glycoprotein [Halorubrum sp. SD626R]|uniref:HVO_2072 family ArtA-dependent S-layer glycoprotein n=1 Tax=Halorubrum sp. SD626R TaxID=1419722 RepID=UPI0013052C0A|nr:HVO_2072 family ArtA-dependent S-layer glycoprotein [Halorubrum sp. SD626R]